MNMPLARSEALVIEELGDELLVYDLEADRGHSLGPAAARVWRACDGDTSLDRLAAQLDLDAETLARAVEELTACNLLVKPTLAVTTNGGGVVGSTRRELGIRAAKIGAAAASLPLIVSVVAPTAAQAITETFCQGIVVSAQGCGDCHKFGCCCCFPPGGAEPGSKPCHADCITTSDCFTGNQNCNGSTDNCKGKV